MEALSTDSISAFAESDDNKIVLSVNIPPGNRLFLQIVYEELLRMQNDVYTLHINSNHVKKMDVEIEEAVPIDILRSTSRDRNTTVWRNERKKVKMSFDQNGPISISYNVARLLERKKQKREISTHVDMSADGSFVYHITTNPTLPTPKK